MRFKESYVVKEYKKEEKEIKFSAFEIKRYSDKKIIAKRFTTHGLYDNQVNYGNKLISSVYWMDRERFLIDTNNPNTKEVQRLDGRNYYVGEIRGKELLFKSVDKMKYVALKKNRNRGWIA